MVHCFLASPFIDAARAGLFAAVQAALQAEAGPETLLLGNLVLADGTAPLDAVVVRSRSITLLVFALRGGRLNIPALGYGRWLLNGAPVPGFEDFDNPFEQFREQKAALADWLQPRFTRAQADMSGISGLVLFETSVEFGADVAAALNAAPAGFQIARHLADLTGHLRDVATPEINLTTEDIAEWAAEWAAFVAAPSAPESGDTAGAPTSAQPRAAADTASAASTFLGQKARALWGWLGANDVPDDDLPYGYANTLSARNEEKQQLEHLRQQMQADLSAQLQALEAREAERERSIAQLRTELAQAPPVAAEATALVSRLGAETREKAALEAEMQASRDELAARNQELDAKIQQLSQLIGQLNASPAAAPPVATPLPTAAAASVTPVAAAGPSVAAATPVAESKPVPVLAPSPTTVVAGAIASAPPISGPIRSTPDMPANHFTAAPPVAKSHEEASPLVSAFSAHIAQLQARGRAATAALRPRLQQAWEWGQAQPRAALAAAGVAVLALGIWGLSHAGSAPPVPFQENGRWGYADASGQPVIPAQFTAASPFEKGQAVVAKDGAYGFVDEKGQEIIPAAYDALNPYADGYARARVGNTYTFIDEDGQEFDHYYFNALDFAEGHAAVLDHRGWHYISGPTEPDTPPVIFKEAYSFADGLARVKLPDGFTFITADYLADPSQGTKPFGRYQLASDFVDGKARVKQAGRSFTINKDGEEVK